MPRTEAAFDFECPVCVARWLQWAPVVTLPKIFEKLTELHGVEFVEEVKREFEKLGFVHVDKPIEKPTDTRVTVN
jgi:hypothetical protein